MGLCVGVVEAVRVGKVRAEPKRASVAKQCKSASVSPVLEIDRRAALEDKAGVVEDGLPVADTPLQRDK